MNLLCCSEKHKPQKLCDVIGLGGFSRKELSSVFCLIANDDNNYLNEGIVLNSLLFIDPTMDFREGALNVFRQNDEVFPFRLCRSQFPNAEYAGRIFMTINHYGG